MFSLSFRCYFPWFRMIWITNHMPSSFLCTSAKQIPDVPLPFYTYSLLFLPMLTFFLPLLFILLETVYLNFVEIKVRVAPRSPIASWKLTEPASKQMLLCTGYQLVLMKLVWLIKQARASPTAIAAAVLSRRQWAWGVSIETGKAIDS